MARTPLLRLLQRLARTHDHPGKHRRGITRRDLRAGAGALATGIVVRPRRLRATATPRIAIVGAASPA